VALAVTVTVAALITMVRKKRNVVCISESCFSSEDL
jgi:hypothetical protein